MNESSDGQAGSPRAKFQTDPIRGIEIEAHVPAQSTHSPS
jgi:hypothetical protein